MNAKVLRLSQLRKMIEAAIDILDDPVISQMDIPEDEEDGATLKLFEAEKQHFESLKEYFWAKSGEYLRAFNVVEFLNILEGYPLVVEGYAEICIKKMDDLFYRNERHNLVIETVFMDGGIARIIDDALRDEKVLEAFKEFVKDAVRELFTQPYLNTSSPRYWDFFLEGLPELYDSHFEALRDVVAQELFELNKKGELNMGMHEEFTDIYKMYIDGWQKAAAEGKQGKLF